MNASVSVRQEMEGFGGVAQRAPVLSRSQDEQSLSSLPFDFRELPREVSVSRSSGRRPPRRIGPVGSWRRRVRGYPDPIERGSPVPGQRYPLPISEAWPLAAGRTSWRLLPTLTSLSGRRHLGLTMATEATEVPWSPGIREEGEHGSANGFTVAQRTWTTRSALLNETKLSDHGE